MVNSYVKNRRQPSLDILFRIADILSVDARQLLVSNMEDQISAKSNVVKVPILGTASCGKPILAVEDKEGDIPISSKLLKNGKQYFILRASGTSMNKANINDGDLVLIRQQQTAKDKDVVVALIDDEVTIKEFHLQNDLVVLKPKSNDISHQPMVLTDDIRIQGVVVRVINF